MFSFVRNVPSIVILALIEEDIGVEVTFPGHGVGITRCSRFQERDNGVPDEAAFRL